MSSQATKWKEEQILIICPGSRTTMAQLGCSELTPPAYRIPTRMFRDEETGEWRPYRTYRRKKQSATGGNANANDEDEWEYVEDPDSDEGAVYPMQGGYIVNMEAFLAFLEHVHGLLTTTFHTTPIVLMTSSQWTRPDCEAIALYIFEKTRTPALSMINSALATQYGLKWPHMTVVDIGFEKVDVTCIYDSRIVNHMAVGFAGEPGDDRAISGGEVFTKRLQDLLRDKGFTYEMAEQLKKSTICEVLPYASENPRLMELPEDDASAPVAPIAAVATNGSAAVATGAAGTDEAQSKAVVDDDLLLEDGTVPAAEDGVLDVAAIVTTGQTKEFLAKKEKERSERGRFGRRNKDKEAAEAAAAKPVRLPNSKRARVVFHFEQVVEEEEEPRASSGIHQSDKSATTAAGESNAKSHDDDADGSDDGSEGEGEGSEMDEDEDEEGDGEDEDVGGEGSGEPKANKPAAASEETSADKPKEESAASAEKPKVEDAPAPAETKAPEAVPATAADTPEKPKEPEATPAPPAASSEEKPATSEDATMEDAPASKEEAAADKTEAPAEKPAEPAEPAPAAVTEETASSTALVSTAPAPAPAPAPALAEAAVITPAAAEPQGRRYKRLRRDFEIGLERFTFADRYEIDRIVTAIYRTVQGIDEFYMRPACWDNLVFVGNGCRLRGLRDNILQTLSARHLISPSTATMFTSELPSNMGTPTGTGSQTPTGSFNTPPHQLPMSSSVNPLLQVATTNALGQSVVGGPGSVAGGEGANNNAHHFHAQTPTSIKLATLPTYLGEWTKNGFEEAMFLGAQVAARLAFCVHNLDAAGQEGQRQMSLSRVDYNELGPKGIRNHAMLG